MSISYCFGAVDGKHIAIVKPKKSGSTYHNYKGFFSIVLLGLVDAHYRFTFADIGCQGRISDGGVLRNTSFFTDLINDTLPLPPDRQLPNLNPDPLLSHCSNSQTMPLVFVADDAFTLTGNCMKPYPQKGLTESRRIYNYRLSRARNPVENAFGILVQRFRSLKGTLQVEVDSAIRIALCACLLHNMLCTFSASSYAPHGFADEINDDGQIIPGEWRQEGNTMVPLEPTQIRNCKLNAKEVRKSFRDYFENRGSIPWQCSYSNIL